MIRKMSPLTQEEQRFAAENAYMIFDFMAKYNLQFSDFYGMLACRYVMSVRDWFSRPELHNWKFSTVAYKAMHGAYATWCREQKMAKRNAVVVSLNTKVHEDEDAGDFMSLVPDNGASVEDYVLSKMSIKSAFSKLSHTQKRICAMASAGYLQSDVAKRTGFHQSYISTSMKQFKENYEREG